jgi:hypothetical protein
MAGLNYLEYDATLLIIMSLISTITATIVGGILANRKERRVGRWILASIFLGWIAVIVLACMKTSPEPQYNAPLKSCPHCGDTLKAGECGVCGFKDKNYHVVFYKQERTSSATVSKCPQCNEILKSGSCDMCGYRDPKYHFTQKSAIPQKTIPSYQCASCGETINTSRCPYCGWEKK